ncbi:MAG: putative sulfate exporter family transporter [Gammaproteobacteria bacterium]|nr:putative sulfate exporter family transporter [Gammaproteobacteria bacterium]
MRFCLERILRAGIVLLGIRLSLAQVGEIGLRSLPVIAGVVATALVIVTFVSRRAGLSGRLGTLIAVGTSICGATAIVATAPTILAKDDEVAYAVACVTLFGVIAMIIYPFAAHWIFAADAFRSGLFLGTSVHETAQVAGAGLVYEQYFGDPAALDTATVTKLMRNLCMLIVIPMMTILYHRKSTENDGIPPWWSMVPLFIIGFALMSLIRTVGDLGDMAFGMLQAEQWYALVEVIKIIAEWCLAIAMAAVGLGTSIRNLLQIGLKPLGVGLFSAALVGLVSFSLITLLY